MKNLRGIYTLLFGVAVLLFFGLAYPHHLHYQEQFQLFLFDSNYVWDVVRLPGGVADLLGRFCTQFFLYAWVGALIIALLLSAIQLLVLRLFSPYSLPYSSSSCGSSPPWGEVGRGLLSSLRFCFGSSSSTRTRYWVVYGLSCSLFSPHAFLPQFLNDQTTNLPNT